MRDCPTVFLCFNYSTPPASAAFHNNDKASPTIHFHLNSDMGKFLHRADFNFKYPENRKNIH